MQPPWVKMNTAWDPSGAMQTTTELPELPVYPDQSNQVRGLMRGGRNRFRQPWGDDYYDDYQENPESYHSRRAQLRALQQNSNQNQVQPMDVVFQDSPNILDVWRQRDAMDIANAAASKKAGINNTYNRPY